MPLSEVVSALRSGASREVVLSEVRRRRIPSLIVPANELELAANGAGRELIAALKDPHNLATPAQEAAYMRFIVESQSAAAKSKQPRTATR